MDCESRMGGTTMKIECKKRAEGYKPVKGNEEKIIHHLLNHYGKCRVEKNNELSTFHVPNKSFYIKDQTTCFKCGEDGKINFINEKDIFKNYVAVPFDQNNEDLMMIFTAPNFVSFKRDGIRNLVWKNWSLETMTGTFAVNYKDIIIFDEDGEIVDCLMNDSMKIPLNVLTSHDYIVK